MLSNISMSNSADAVTHARKRELEARKKNMAAVDKAAKDLLQQADDKRSQAVNQMALGVGTGVGALFAPVLGPAVIARAVISKVEWSESASLRRRAAALLEHKAYKAERAALEEFTDDIPSLIKSLQEAGLIAAEQEHDRFFTVLPRADATQVLRGRAFDWLSAGARISLAELLRKVVKIGPTLEVIVKEEAQLLTAIERGDSEAAASCTEKISERSAQWELEGT